MKTSVIFVCLAALGVITNSACASEKTATPDPALVAHYEADKDALKAKNAECKKMNDLAAILTDVGCMQGDCT